jgi:hypothetical protein
MWNKLSRAEAEVHIQRLTEYGKMYNDFDYLKLMTAITEPDDPPETFEQIIERWFNEDD